MSRLACLFVAMASASAAVACSHNPKVAQTSTAMPPAPPAVRTPPPPKASPMVVFADSAKAKELDDAIYFDFDSATLRDDARPVLQTVAESARRRNATLEIDGNCDELGTTEYNLALGDERARAAKDYLVHMGVSPDRIRTVSYGAERPKYPGHDEGAHAKNRRDDLLVH